MFLHERIGCVTPAAFPVRWRPGALMAYDCGRRQLRGWRHAGSSSAASLGFGDRLHARILAIRSREHFAPSSRGGS